MIGKKNYKKLRQKLQDNKCVVHYEPDELEYLKSPIGLANYKATPTNTPKYSEKITCPICNKPYARSNGTAHRKTQVHILCAKLNKNFVGLMTGK